ncbi:MAG: lipoate--protein ligase family protein [Gemmatimonadales bacterium]|nr:MAG: lipoate--protein ligase family protein [Gemmatimonadales bacterium]
MAVDEALARHRLEGEATLRIYRWVRPSLSFGRNQAVEGRYDPHALRSLGVEVVRRPTGGREVLHDRELTYAVVLPAGSPGSPRGIYRAVNGALLDALRALGVRGEIAAPAHRTPPPDAGACFGDPAAGEVVVQGRKLVGSAQLRMGRTLLQHGSLLLDRPSVDLGAVVSVGAAGSPRSGPLASGTTLRELGAGPVSFVEIASTVEAAVAATFGGRWRVAEALTPEEAATADELEPRYLDPLRTWRR